MHLNVRTISSPSPPPREGEGAMHLYGVGVIPIALKLELSLVAADISTFHLIQTILEPAHHGSGFKLHLK
jgi:hypothetical protein